MPSDLISLLPSKNHRRLCLVLLSALTVLHFALPPIVTFDSGHYLSYTRVIFGERPLSEWDVVRGPVFPVLLALTVRFLGYSPFALLCFTWFGLLGAFFLVLALIRKCLVTGGGRSAALLSAVVLVFLQPVFIGYYHAVLTEFFCATLFLLGMVLSLEWLKTSFDISPRRFIREAALMAAFSVIAYHLKQPYISSILFPFTGAAVFSVFLDPSLRNVLQRSAVLLSAVLATVVSVVVWQAFLPDEGAAGMYSRGPAGIVTNLLVSQQAYAQKGPTLQNVSEEEILRDSLMTEEARQAGVRMKNEGTSSEQECSRIISILDFSKKVIGRTIIFCNGEPSLREAVRFMVWYSVRHPLSLAGGFVRSFFELTGFKRSRFTSSENASIAYRVFQVGPKLSNVFPVSPALEPFVKPMRTEGTVGSLVRVPWSYGVRLNTFLFTWILSLSGLFLILLVGWALIRRKSAAVFLNNRKTDTAPFVFIAVFSSFFHIVAHCFGAATIDRYCFPVFPVMMLALIFLTARFVEKKVTRDSHC